MAAFWTYVKEHRGRMIGLAVGFVLPLLWWIVGFWRTTLWAVCVAAGYFIGRAFEDSAWFYSILEKILPRKED